MKIKIETGKPEERVRNHGVFSEDARRAMARRVKEDMDRRACENAEKEEKLARVLNTDYGEKVVISFRFTGNEKENKECVKKIHKYLKRIRMGGAKFEYCILKKRWDDDNPIQVVKDWGDKGGFQL